MSFVTTSSSLMLLFNKGYVACQNFNATGPPICALRDLHYSTGVMYQLLTREVTMVPNPDSKQYWNNWKNDMSLFSATNWERTYKQSYYSTVSLYTTLSFPTGEYTLNSQIFVFPILALLVFVNSICFIHTGKLTCLYYPPSWTLNV